MLDTACLTLAATSGGQSGVGAGGVLLVRMTPPAGKSGGRTPTHMQGIPARTTAMTVDGNNMILDARAIV